MVVVSDPRLIRQLFVKDASIFNAHKVCVECVLAGSVVFARMRAAMSGLWAFYICAPSPQAQALSARHCLPSAEVTISQGAPRLATK